MRLDHLLSKGRASRNPEGFRKPGRGIELRTGIVESAVPVQRGQQDISVIEIGKAGMAQEPLLPLPVGTRPRETPVNIPNTTVKAGTADCTTLGTAWETRWLPAFWGYSSAG